MSVDEQERVRRRQAEAMANAQAWGLAVHACAIHHSHPYARDMLNADITAPTDSGGIGLVVAALGDLFADSIGVQKAIAVAGNRAAPARSAESYVSKLASLLADTVDYDGEEAITAMTNWQARSEVDGMLGDAIKERDDRQQP